MIPDKGEGEGGSKATVARRVLVVDGGERKGRGEREGRGEGTVAKGFLW